MAPCYLGTPTHLYDDRGTGCSVPIEWVFCTPTSILVAPMAKSKLNLKVPPVSPEDAQRMVRLVDEAMKGFEGIFDELESAIGMYFVGRLVGWRVLVLIHNKRTIKKYEEILGIDIRKEFPEEGLFVSKSLGYEIAKKLGTFWKAVAGEIRLEGRRDLAKG